MLSSQPDLLDLLRDFKWKALFSERRADVMRAMRFVVFGHATYEGLLKPFRGLTAKAILHDIDEPWLHLPAAAQLAAVERPAGGGFDQRPLRLGRAISSPCRCSAFPASRRTASIRPITTIPGSSGPGGGAPDRRPRKG